MSLGGWSILNRADEAHPISDDAWLGPREMRSVVVKGAVLSNKGSTITLLDPTGHKVDGASCTAEMAREAGRLVLFR